MKRLGCVLPVVFLLGLAGGLLAANYLQDLSEAERIKKQLDDHGPIRPFFLQHRIDCRRSDAAQQLDDAMARVLAAATAIPGRFPDDAITGDVISYFGWKWRIIGPETDKCPPTDATITGMLPALDRLDWPQVNTELNDLRLIRRLPANSKLAAGLAKIAFLKSIPPSTSRWEDSRPFARQLLGD